MTKKKINIIIAIMVVFIAIFFAGSFAYETYKQNKSDQQYEESLDKDLDNAQKENSSGQTNEESKNNA